MSHEIDTAIYLMGKVKEVFVKKNINKLDINVEDNAKIIMKHENGCESKLILNFASKRIVRKFQIKTNKNKYNWDFFDENVCIGNKKHKFRIKNDQIYNKQMKNLLLILRKKNMIIPSYI